MSHTELKGLGWKKDLRTFELASESVSRMLMNAKFGSYELPSEFDELSKFVFIRDQQITSACTGFALAGAVATKLRSLGFAVGHFSPQYNYSGGRMIARAGHLRDLQDDGAYPFMVKLFAQGYGFVPEENMPFDIGHVNLEPSLDDFQVGSQFRLSHCPRIDLPSLRVEYIQRSLRNGNPVWLGLQVGSEFQRYQDGNKPVGIEMANTGGHMVYLTGYSNKRRAFKMPNSWSTNWGDNGYAWISYDKIENANNCSDIYEISITENEPSKVQKMLFEKQLEDIKNLVVMDGDII